MTTRSPRVTICIPVRNGEKYLRRCIDSILAQTFSDFELIVCDNASTDATPEICQAYVARDARIRYRRHDRNIGPAGNFNCGVYLARGEYFRWQAHDDIAAPDHLAQCVAALDNDPSAVVAYPQVMIIDQSDQPIEPYDLALRTDSAHASRRFRAMVMANHRRHRNFEIFGLMRTSVLRRTPLQEAYAHGDRVMMVRMALLGRMVQIPQRLFLARRHQTQSMQTLPSHVSNGTSLLARFLGPGPLPPPEWWDPSRAGRVNFPEWNLLRQYWLSVHNACLNRWQRFACQLILCEWTLRRMPRLLRDLAFAAETLVWRTVRLICDRLPRNARGEPRRRASSGAAARQPG